MTSGSHAGTSSEAWEAGRRWYSSAGAGRPIAGTSGSWAVAALSSGFAGRWRRGTPRLAHASPWPRAAGPARRAASRAREGIAYLWTGVLVHPGRPLAPVLGIRPQNVYRAAAQGRTAAAAWERVLLTC